MALTPEDSQQIQTLYSRYAFATDFGPSETWVDCFTADGCIELRGGRHAGREALMKFAQAMHSKKSTKRHWVGNMLLEASAHGATGRAYIALFDAAEMPRKVDTTGFYEDELMKTPEGWKFSLRRITFDSQ